MNHERPFPVFTLITALLALAACVPSWAGALAYDRPAVAAGQWWRLLTCQWTHFTIEHLAWDLAVYVGLGLFCERRSRRATIAVVLAAMIVIPLVAHFACPAVTHFRGLSGIDCALFALLTGSLASDAINDGQPRVVVVILTAWAAFATKMMLEIVTGETLFVPGAAFAALPAAHLAGFILGSVGSVFVRQKASGALAFSD